MLLILNALLSNVISSIASYRLNCKPISNIARARDDLNKKEGRREFPRLGAWKALIVAVAVRSKRALIERMSVIYSESIINLLSVARAEQHRPLRVTWDRKATGQEVEDRKQDVYSANGIAPRVAPRLWQENNLHPSVFKWVLSKWKRSYPIGFRADPQSCSFRVYSRL